jgi:cytochrome c nitrite reductase small subunit
MGKKNTRRIGLFALAVLVLAVPAAIFMMLGPPRLLAESETPAFCAGCHVMELEYEAWSHAGAHRRQKCVDCHLPNQNTAAHYWWKGIDGMKDTLAFYSGRVAERIEISDHGLEVVQANCVRCHTTTVDLINQKRLCWECHRRISHRRTGQVQTL